MADPTPAEIRRAVAANAGEPFGRPRIVRAERLVDAADRTADREARFLALAGLIEAYQFGGEGHRSPVPFSRLLRLWDEHGAGFDTADRAAHTVHWMFKWLSSSLLDVPSVPLATVEHFVEEMERRYRVAGYSLRPVYHERFDIADHLGRTAEAEEYHRLWLGSERDRMANCHACEQLALGRWRAERGDDEAALEHWAPTLDGRLSCGEEPERTLAESLLPLVRLGRHDEARANHLRGYRMVRGRDSLRYRVGQHMVFCALTGNEGRGLEILAEHRGWFDQQGGIHTQMEYHVSVGVLLRRVAEAGSPDLPVPGPGGRDWPAAELRDHLAGEVARVAALFDARNGNDAVSRRMREQGAREPLLDSLLLGVRSPRVQRAQAPLPMRPPAAEEDLDGLVAEARRLFTLGHPDSETAWERVAAAAAARSVRLDDRTFAELCESRASAAANAADLSEQLRQGRLARLHYAAADVAGRAAVFDAQVLVDEAEADGRRVDRARLEEIRREVGRLHEAGLAEPRDVLTVRMTMAMEAREAFQRADAVDRETAVDYYARTAAALLDDARRHRLDGRQAQGHHLLSEVALAQEDPDRAVWHLETAIETAEGAGRPWAAVRLRVALAQPLAMLGRSADAEAAVLAAYAEAARWPRLQFAQGPAALLLSNVTADQGRFADSARHALEAADWADRNTEPDIGAAARYALAHAYELLDRDADAAAVLEAALPEILDHADAATVVNARWTLGRCLTTLNDHRAAATQFAEAARLAETFPNRNGYAMLAAAAGHALNAAGLSERARQAFENAVDELRALDDPINLAKTLRALAWLVFNAAGPADDETDETEETEEEPEGSGGGTLRAGRPQEEGGRDKADHGEPDQDRADPDGPAAGEAAREAALDHALLLFAEAARALENGAGSGAYGGSLEAAATLAFEAAETDDQLARLHLNAELPEKALAYAERAAHGFKALLPERDVDFDYAEQMAAWLTDRYLGRDIAIVRLRQALAVARAAGVELPRCAALLAQFDD